MPAYRLLRLGLGVSLFVLLTGVAAASRDIHGAFEIIWASLLAIAALTAAIVAKVKTPANPNRNGRIGTN